MALTVIKPSGIETSGNYTVNGMNVSANASVANLTVTTSLNLLTNSANLGPVGNVIITGGTNGYVLQTDGAGNLSWQAPASGSSIANGNSNVSIPAANGNINFTAVGNTVMVITGTGANIAGTANVSGNLIAGNANLGNLVTANLFTGTLTTNAQPNITSVGTLTALTVTGNVTGGNLVTAGKVYSSDIINGGTGIYLSAGPSGYINFFTTGGDKASITDTGNIIASNLIANSTVFATTANISANVNAGNANLGNLVTANLFTGTLTTAAQPNITSVGTLTDVSVSGNGVFGGNLTVNGTLTYINSTTLSISDPIINLQTGPNGAAPVANTGKDVGTALNYYDTSAKIAWMGWDVSNAEIAFGSNVGISSEVVTFTELANIRSGNAQLGNNVTANFFTGNGSFLTGITTTSIANGNSNVNIPSANGNINLTAVGNTTMVITGTGANIAGTANVTGNLVAGNANLGNLVTANLFTGTLTTAAQPNITSVGSLTGLTVSNATGVVNFTTTANVTLGAVANLHIAGGSNTQYLQTDGTGNLTWASIAAGSGISNGTSNISIPVTNGNINLTAGGNTSLVVTDLGANISGNMQSTGNITAQYFVGNGFYLTGVDTSPANIANGTSNVEVALSGNVTTSVAGNANILTVTGTGIVVSGNATIGAGTGGNLSGVNVVSATTVTTSGNISASGNSSAQYFVGNGFYLTGVDTSPANISNGISNVQVYLDSNITMSVAGNANILTVTGTGINVSGNATIGTGTGGNLSGVNVVSANTFTAVANISSGANVSAQYFVGNGFYLTGVDTSPANITNGTSNVEVALSGNVTTSVAGNANILTVTGTGIVISGNATIGTGTGGNLSGVNVISANTFTALSSVNFVSASNVSLGAVGNVKITGGTSSYVLSTDGTGNLSWIAPGSGSSGISNGNSNVNIPAANGNINLTAVGNTTAVITGTGVNVAGTLNATGNIIAGNANLGNAVTANFFIGSGNNLSNISGANVTGQVSNALVAGTVTTAAQPNITSVGSLTDLSVSGNGVFGGNLTVNGTLTYINSTTLSISDPIINLQTGPNGAAPVANTGKDVGTALNYYDTSAKIAWMGWDVSNAEIAFGSNVGISSEVVTFTSLANIRSGNASLGNLVTANFFIGSGNNLSNISGANVSGTVANATYAISAGTAATVTTNAQPNITSVGNLSGLTVSNATGVVDFTTTANVTLGAVANLHISGGTNGYVLSTDGSGALSWVAQSGGGGGASISNGNSNVNIPTANGNINFTAVGNTTAVISGTGVNVAGTLNTTGNVTFTGANISLGNVGNVRITGGTANYVLKTDGTGNLDWVEQSAAAAATVTVDNFTGNGVQTIFTLSTTPIGINQTSVNYNGATVLRTDYTLANANITFSSAPASGSYIEVTTINLASGGGGITAQDLLSPFLLMGA